MSLTQLLEQKHGIQMFGGKYGDYLKSGKEEKVKNTTEKIKEIQYIAEAKEPYIQKIYRMSSKVGSVHSKDDIIKKLAKVIYNYIRDAEDLHPSHIERVVDPVTNDNYAKIEFDINSSFKDDNNLYRHCCKIYDRFDKIRMIEQLNNFLKERIVDKKNRENSIIRGIHISHGEDFDEMYIFHVTVQILIQKEEWED